MSAIIVGAGALVATLLAPAPLPLAILEPAFQNTIVSTYPDGKSTKLWLERNGQYEALRANGQRTGGSWQMKGDRLCMTQRRPIFVPLAFCTGIPSLKGGVGVSWTAKGLKGEPVRHTVVAGRGS
ncbi:hypothetical protein [Caulobacter mirabilis]|uniref:DUF995 domain-containing protein n=1 Tax=Caulobacter mirabilis TaxID=69666 RepID=A0A2D2AYU8_9CAUL|nr:hypothetical protein [Caulobacter mirabilis]ATQ43155.1 hypothetical protein CSW64_12385 [Caulobacter mirabilis]